MTYYYYCIEDLFCVVPRTVPRQFCDTRAKQANMLSMNDLRVGIIFLWNNQPHKVLEARHLKVAQRRPIMQTKIKNLATGQVISQNFQQNDKFEEAKIIKEKIVFIYANKNKGEYWFHKESEPGKRFFLSENQIEDIKLYLKSGPSLELLKFNDQIIGIELPIKMDFKVIETPPNIKGSTAQGGNKIAIIETGAKINVPLFINEGDIITLNTKTGEYAQRAR